MYRIAFYVDGKFNGCVGNSEHTCYTNKEDAQQIALRWIKAHGGKYDYRAIETNEDGYMIWEDICSI